MTLVLIVDDEPAVSEVLKEIVTAYGFQAMVAASAKAAVSLLATHRFSLILLDLAMPDITGDQFLTFIRKKGFRLPVVVVSAHLDEEREKFLRAAGISGVVRKPFDVGQIIDEMEAALKGKSAEG